MRLYLELPAPFADAHDEDIEHLGNMEYDENEGVGISISVHETDYFDQDYVNDHEEEEEEPLHPEEGHINFEEEEQDIDETDDFDQEYVNDHGEEEEPLYPEEDQINLEEEEQDIENHGAVDDEQSPLSFGAFDHNSEERLYMRLARPVTNNLI
jgi:hypothetical protein